MILENPVYNDDVVRGRDLQEVVDAVNANEVFTDNMTIIGSKSEAGMSLSVVDQYGGGVGGGQSGGNVYPVKIQSGSNGVYKGIIIDQNTGEATGDIIDAIATRATGYDLPADSYVVAYKVSVETLGSN